MAIKVIVDETDFSYRVVDQSSAVLFQGGDLAVFVDGKWCTTASTSNTTSTWNMTMEHKQVVHGQDPALGDFEGIQFQFQCHAATTAILLLVTFRNLPSAVVFDLNFPNGAPNTNMSDPETSNTNFPTFLLHPEEVTSSWSYLSWHGSFVQSVRGLSTGPLGGPTVFYNASDPDLKVVLVGSPWRNDNPFFKSFTAGTNRDWKGRPAWAPGTSARIQHIPKGFTQSFILYQSKNGGGITSSLYEWGQAMQLLTKKSPDVTLQQIGYQTDNGAAYCFCHESNCSQTVRSLSIVSMIVQEPCILLTECGSSATAAARNGGLGQQ
eukprot:scaffold91_cov127-Cylindrotheca_fusiformis.AAC.9